MPALTEKVSQVDLCKIQDQEIDNEYINAYVTS